MNENDVFFLESDTGKLGKKESECLDIIILALPFFYYFELGIMAQNNGGDCATREKLLLV